MRTWTRVAAATLVLALVSVFAAADAVRTTTYAQWGEFTGSANNYVTSFQLPVTGFPAASVTSDSRAGSVGITAGATTWFGENTPIGLAYGSSRNQPYLSLRPRVDNATGGSTTTYVFTRPTPATGWTFALSDIDADQATVSATDVNGAPVSEADLGFAGGFNFCDTTPRPSACSTSTGDAPTWDPATRTLVGNPTATDTVGATGWFEPTVRIKTLSIVFTRRVGFPLYSTSFAAAARTLSGTVTDVSTSPATCVPDSVSVRLVGPDGNEIATTTPDASGAYSFGQVATQPGYTVSVEPPPTCAAVAPRSRTVSTADEDAIANFSVREIVPYPVSGAVTAGGAPLAGVAVTLHLPGGSTETTTTGADGRYLFDDEAIGEGYFVSIEVPDGYTGDDQRPPFDIDAAPVTGEDFTLTANPDVSGTVTGGGSGVGGVTVTLTPATGPPVSTVTEADGSYVFERVPSGTYDIAVEPPAGYDPAPALTDVDVDADDVTGQDFALTRPGALGGQVTDEHGAPVAGARVVVDGPNGPQTLTTDADGQYFADGLSAGDYTITVTALDGYEIIGEPTRNITITDAGETLGGQDFQLRALPDEVEPTSPPTTSPTTTPSSTPPVSTSDDSTTSSSDYLSDTGADSPLPLYAGLLLLAAGAVTLLVARRRD